MPAPGSPAHGRPRCGAIRPDQRLDHELRQLLGRGAQRKNHLGQTRREDAEFIVESDATIVAPLIFNWVLGK